MQAVKGIALILVIVGALNWGLVGLFDFNLVSAIFGVDSVLTNLVYILVGISAVICLPIFSDLRAAATRERT